MYDVITVGSSTIDVFAKTEKSDLISFQTKNSVEKESFLAYPVGSKILIESLIFTTGGGGTNTAYCLSRLGVNTAYLGKIGNDENGDMIIDKLKKEKIDFIGKRADGFSGYSIILDSIAKDRTILTFKGVNNDFRFNEIEKSNVKAKWFYLCAMMGKSYKELEKIVDYAKKNKIKVMFNPSSYLAEKGVEYLNKVLKNTDILVLNREEAQILVGKHEPKSLLNLLSKHIKKGIVIITDGSNGVYVMHKNKTYYGKPHVIKVIETTGAGDAFGSSFLAGMILKNDVVFSTKLAMTNAESVITTQGPKHKLLLWKEATKAMRSKPVKVTPF